MLTHIQATHHGAVMAPCFQATLHFLMPISPVLVPQSAPPSGHNLSAPLRDSENRHRWDPAHLHTFPSVPPPSTEDGGKGRNVAMPGTPQSKPCVTSTKACTPAHSPAYIPKVTMPPANEWYPSASSGFNQVGLVRGIQFNGLRGKKCT